MVSWGEPDSMQDANIYDAEYINIFNMIPWNELRIQKANYINMQGGIGHWIVNYTSTQNFIAWYIQISSEQTFQLMMLMCRKSNFV